ncbi:MAG: glycosyltransferase family 4 protein [Ruminococcus sp.]|nr:glycosyltransferase family 4 protein [Ruminococcus sp.]
MKKKVLILANNSDGLFRFRHDLLQELKNRYDIIASTPFDHFIPELEKICDEVIQTDFDRRSINPVNDFRLLKTYLEIVNRVKPDLIITYTIKPNIYGGLVSRLKKVTYAVNITGLGTAFEKKGIVQEIVVLLYKIALKKAKIVFFENSGDRNVFVNKTKIPINKTYVLHGAGVNTQTYAYQAYPSNDKIRFLFIGRIMKEKGIEELFEAGQRLVREGFQCHLDVVGPCEENYKAKLEECEKSGWLKYHGFQSDVKPYIKDCDCFVLPSYHEGMANTNLECASSGRPIITSNIPGCKEAVVEGSGFLCEPKDANSLYEAMKKMIMEENREKMGRIGRKHMEDVFDKRKVVAETLKHLL